MLRASGSMRRRARLRGDDLSLSPFAAIIASNLEQAASMDDYIGDGPNGEENGSDRRQSLRRVFP